MTFLRRVFLVLAVVFLLALCLWNSTSSINSFTSLLVQERKNEGAASEDSTNRIPPSVVLWTAWRSGSTFLGQLLANAENDTFYSYEPVHFWKEVVRTESDSTTRTILKYLNDILHCRWQDYDKQVTYLDRAFWWHKHNAFLNKHCYPEGLCDNAAFVSYVCSSANVHVAKVLRLSLRWVRHLLLDPTLDLRVIYMIRDPRAILNSRDNRKIREWCKHPTCIDPAQVCSILRDDLGEVPALLEEFPNRFLYVQYDRLSENIEESIKDILSFAGLPVSDFIKERLKENAKSKARGNVSDVIVDTKGHLSLWRQELDFRKMLSIQKSCTEVLNLLGLRLFKTKEDYDNTDLPAVLEKAPSLSHF